MKHGFVKVAAAMPPVALADCHENQKRHMSLLADAKKEGVTLLVFPELSLVGSTCKDLLFSEVLLQQAKDSLLAFAHATSGSDIISIIGLPLLVNDKLYNSAAICQNGQILGVIPKAVTRNCDDFRYFCQAPDAVREITLGGMSVPFGNVLFACREIPELRFSAAIGENRVIGEDAVTVACAAGATVVAHLCATPELVGAEEYRRTSARHTSERCLCGYVRVESGMGESTTDTVYASHTVIAECGEVLAEHAPFASESLLITELDVQRIAYERRRYATMQPVCAFESVSFSLTATETKLSRCVEAHPFMPAAEKSVAARCERILAIQSHGLAQRLEKAYAKCAVLGISGGLDSCLAILVAAEAMDLLGRPRTDVLGVTMPCFGTTKRTRSNAELICEALGVSLRTVDVSTSVTTHLADIGHDMAVHDVTFENAQARERTQVLMDIANEYGGMVIGTGDLSELALGWATYNGDHMSMYGVNGSLPKTLIRHVVAWYADRAEQGGNDKLAAVLRDILDTPVSPELLPADADGNIAQKTEDLVGPYELHDFYLFYMLRYGFAPDKLYRLAKCAFAGVYEDAVLLHWLKNLIRRFFTQQFKRSCLPDGPKVGTVGLSPRGDWQMPSDACAAMWLKMVEDLQL